MKNWLLPLIPLILLGCSDNSVRKRSVSFEVPSLTTSTAQKVTNGTIAKTEEVIIQINSGSQEVTCLYAEGKGTLTPNVCSIVKSASGYAANVEIEATGSEPIGIQTVYTVVKEDLSDIYSERYGSDSESDSSSESAVGTAHHQTPSTSSKALDTAVETIGETNTGDSSADANSEDENSDNNEMNFDVGIYYAASELVVSGESRVVLEPELKINLDGAATFSGRYVGKNGTGPTGELIMHIQFDPNRPAVKAGNQFIYAGWVNNLLFDDTYPVQYFYRGQSLFGQALTSTQLYEYQSDNPATLFAIPEYFSVMGFVGPGVTTGDYKFCYGPEARLALGLNDEYGCSSWDNLLADNVTAAEVSFIDRLYSDRLALEVDGGGEGVVLTAHSGVFGVILGAEGGSLMHVDDNNVLSWNYVDGMSDLIAGTKLFALSSARENFSDALEIYEGDEQVSCDDLISGKAPSSYDLLVDIKDPTVESLDVSQYPLDDPHVVICPYLSNGRALGSSLDNIFGDRFGHDDGGHSDQPYLRIEDMFNYESPISSSTADENHYATHPGIETCQSIKFKLFKCSDSEDGSCNSQPHNAEEDLEISLNGSESVFTYHNDPLCGGSISSIEIEQGSNNVEVWVNYQGPISSSYVEITEEMTGVSISNDSFDFSQFESNGGSDERHFIHSTTEQGQLF